MHARACVEIRYLTHFCAKSVQMPWLWKQGRSFSEKQKKKKERNLDELLLMHKVAQGRSQGDKRPPWWMFMKFLHGGRGSQSQSRLYIFCDKVLIRRGG